MNRIAFTLITAATLATLSAAPAGKGANRRRAMLTPPTTPTPAAPAAPKLDTNSPWHVWSDAQGRKVEAAFRALAGNLCTVQTKDGQTLRLNLDTLIPADKAFAQAFAAKLNESRFQDAYVKQAAYQIDHLIGTTLVAQGL